MNKVRAHFSMANIQKISFVIFLAIVLIGYDLLFNGTQTANKLSSNNDLPRVLIYGGSMINNIELALNTWREEHGDEGRFEFITFLKLRLSSREVFETLPDVIKLYRPDTIMLMIGFNEVDGSAGKTLIGEHSIVDRTEYVLKLKDLTSLKSDQDLNHELLKLLDEIMASRNVLYIHELATFFKNSPKTFSKRLDHVLIYRSLFEKLDSLMTKSEEDILFSFNLMRLANSFFETQEKISLLGDDEPFFNTQYVDRTIWKKESRLLDFIRENVASIDKNGCAALIQKALNAKEKVESYWLCQMEHLRRISGVEFSEDFYFSVEHALIPYLAEILPLWRTASLGTREKSKFKSAIEKTIKKLGRPFEIKIEDSHVEDFKDNLIKIKSLTDSYGVRLVLLHYPNLKQKWVSDICSELGIVEVSGKNFTHKSLTAANWSKYFIDRIAGSGHMSELGARLYVESMMKQLGGIKFFEDAARQSYGPAFMNP